MYASDILYTFVNMGFIHKKKTNDKFNVSKMYQVSLTGVKAVFSNLQLEIYQTKFIFMLGTPK